MKKSLLGFSVGVIAVCILVIIVLATGFWKRFFYQAAQEQHRIRIVIPRETGAERDFNLAEQRVWEENLNTKIAMNEGEIVVAILNHEFEGSFAEEQIAAYRKQTEIDGPVYVAFIKYDERSREYKRIWDAPTAATRSETISLFSQDLIGDINNCILITGMNNKNEHSMTVFRRSLRGTGEHTFKKIAELQIDGSIIIQENERSLAYQQGIARGSSHNIVVYGHDNTSQNILDQLETTYTFNPSTEQYGQSTVTRIPGSQIEQRRLRELLSGKPGVFENFINELWYYVSPQGTLDSRQFIYFDLAGKEIIFFGDENQQVFTWQNSTPTRYGLYITCQNISISTLKRSLFIELESLDSIRLRVTEDLRIKITVSASWDGSYRRAGNQVKTTETEKSIKQAINAAYDSLWGRLQFYDSGEYSINSNGSYPDAAARKGRYVFFTVNEQKLLELRPEGNDPQNGENRMVYRVDTKGNDIFLFKVRLGAGGIQDLLEPPIMLTKAENR